MNTELSIQDRVKRENLHGKAILQGNEANWGWHTPAGKIRQGRRTEFLIRECSGLSENPKVLEVGCGTGVFTTYIFDVYKDLTGIDISESLIEVGRQRFPGVSLQLQDIHKTTFPDETFDLILGCNVLHHLDWDIALREMNRILRPGGQIRFSEPNLANPQVFLQKNWPWLKKRMGESPDEYAFTSGQIRKSLKVAGFKEIHVQSYEFLHPHTPVRWIQSVIRLERFIEKSPLRKFAGSLKMSAVK